ncbi:putative PAP-specific phosphatase, mitochondrial [Syzygium oleosum]|uniref:putative PAP-specific phosphatase, mitochondrial n=1 Tax=Syzygium oleosum TaxID=219896 RepID=UPI0011D1A012|nr:putative PAP-specific phosphatase, mitochondrial [Syzygium oleosum]XP_056172089.1 putative PAP-specific phosphatase, mitochondrial [Syzygium oleosum]XP_056172090.1 putative PAP-specific phosphatase, mitochondrial [Syzygium oleosum]XP_056172091.1 putative PAP-specific phosphatase, mitochondrial [Syzygium oleosum]XP_056172092.1 putative PAP-specific phosphatase, mitochondrial [Syzygium oleosum]XP_056172093.1 putative PAP-specific phosphatase, mitochondrial [Syzygium oleosum]XP_056172094.1 pu
MAVFLPSASRISTVRFNLPPRSPAHVRRRLLPFGCLGSSLPFPAHDAKYHRELEAAIDVVERACRLCVDVKKALLSSDGGILEKTDQTPVTVADFGVQALVSLELGNLFPSIPLVAEEDSASIRSTDLVGYIVDAVTDKASSEDHPLTTNAVLEAIDRGGENEFSIGAQPASYWVLDPIDGTRGFLKGSESLYVVGLALVVGGEVVLGAMGCPNWQQDLSNVTNDRLQEYEISNARPGIIMVSHVGCGTWTKRLPPLLSNTSAKEAYWTRCFVDGLSAVHEARFCIPESQTWEKLPLSTSFKATKETDTPREGEVVLLPTCCGSLCKYMMVASGRASVFILRERTRTSSKAWDHAVGMICVHEAGGKVTDWEGSQIDLAADATERRIVFPKGGIIVSNGKLHKKILDMTSSGSSSLL